MAQFIAGCRGNREAVTRLGSKASGVHAWARGWNIGASVYTSHGDVCGDIISIYVDGGSSGQREARGLLTFSESSTPQEIAAQLRDAADLIEAHGYGASDDH